MPIKKKRCKFCCSWFTPNPRTSHQVCCDNPDCRKQRKAAANRDWRLRNPGYDKTRAGKKRAWARARGYWRNNRRIHQDYAAKDIKRRCRAYKARKFSANQAMIRKTAVERLNSLRNIGANPSANQDVISRRVDVIVDYLFSKESSANRNHIDCGPAS
jgi:hypothetical protein